MRANKILLQRKYARLIELFAVDAKLSLKEAMDFFYSSQLYQEISEGVSDMHCRSDNYLVEELMWEYKESPTKSNTL